MTKKAKTIFLVVLLVVIALVLRLLGLGSFMTVDEEKWMLRSAEFWHDMFRNADPGGTYITTHPGVTTMWLAGTGIFLQESLLGFDIDTSNLQYFRLAGTLPIAIATSLLIGLVGWLAMSLLGRIEGFWAACLLATEPYFVGMSQVIHLDALLALFMLVALLSFMLLFREGKDKWAIICGMSTGLAMATKLLPSLWLFVFIGMVLLMVLLISCKKYIFYRRKFRYRKLVRTFFYIAGIAVVTLWVVWPALWEKDDLHSSFEEDVPSVIINEHVALEVSTEPIAPASFYVRTWLGRVSVFTLLLSVGMVILAVRAFWEMWREGNIGKFIKTRAFMVLLFVVYIVGFLLLITMVA
jgi:4-amino-4-deoxy-L-arabinose transferase-like glycosyltransferase